MSLEPVSPVQPDGANDLPRSEDDAAFPLPTLRELSLLPLLSGLILVIDELSKNLVEAYLPLYTSWAPFPAIAEYFHLTHATNTGAAFGMFPDGSLFFSLVAAGVAVVILVYNYGLPGGQRLLRLALALQLAGALGNLIDRLRQGHVTDFVDVDFSSIVYIPYISDWPIFNVADLSIVTGVLVLGWLMLRDQRAARRMHAADLPDATTPIHERSIERPHFRQPADERPSS
ncbi:MAG: signal peptidase II [Anaerolineales bacterium]|nr:signal peptidase II [Anaerolineales bacterium]